MKAEISDWLLETLQLISIEDYSAQVFLMGLDSGTLEWQVAVDMIYLCHTSGLIKVIPYTENGVLLTPDRIIDEMTRCDPSSIGTDDWEAAKVWVGTFVVGTIACVELLAKSGLLDATSALVLSSGLRLEADTMPHIFPTLAFDSVEDASSYSIRLRELAEVSRAVPFSVSKEQRRNAFVRDVELIFADHGFHNTDHPLRRIGTS